MANNPTTRQLRSEVRELKTQIAQLKKSEHAFTKRQKTLERSEAKLKLLLKTTSARIVNLDLDGNVLFINHTVTERTENEVTGRSVYDFLTSEEQKKMKRILKTVIRTGKKYRYEPYLIHPDGTVSLFENDVVPVKRKGKVVEFIITATDITERKKAEIALQKAHDALEHRVEERTNELLEANLFMKQEIEERKQAEKALEERERMLRIILDSSPDAIAMTDDRGTIIECNQSCVSMLGYDSKEELIGKSAFDLIVKKERPKGFKNLKKTREKGAVKNIEYMHVKKDGTEFPAELSASVVKNASGKVAGFVAVTKDITDRKKAEKALKKSGAELRKQKVALEEKNIALREIIAQIEIEKRKIKQDINTNVELILSPIPNKIKAKERDDNDVELLHHHLKGLTSSFGSKITDKDINLTPREIEICSMIKGGMTSKDISRLLNISSQTVERHRKNIRHKLGIANRRVNLTGYLRKL